MTRQYLLFSTLVALSLFLSLNIGCVERYAKVEPFTFVQLCDPQLGMGGYEHDVASFGQAVRQINELRPDLVVICGDLVEQPVDESFADFNRIKAGLKIPAYCAPGNHDIGGNPTITSINRYREKTGRDYYSIEHKGYTFVMVNTQLWKAPVEGETEKQDSWLAQTLENARTRKSPVIVVGHYPLFVKTLDEEDEYFNLPVAKRKELLDLYREYGVVAVLAGHTHTTIANEYQGMQLVNGETTSRNFDNRPFGFRLWTVDTATSVRHEFVPLTEGDAE